MNIISTEASDINSKQDNGPEASKTKVEPAKVKQVASSESDGAATSDVQESEVELRERIMASRRAFRKMMLKMSFL